MPSTLNTSFCEMFNIEKIEIFFFCLQQIKHNKEKFIKTYIVAVIKRHYGFEEKLIKFVGIN